MKSFPMFLKMADRRVMICGGGEQAAQKCRLMLKTQAEIVIVASELDEELAALAEAGRVTWYPGPLSQALFMGAALAFVATGDEDRDQAIHAIVSAAGTLVNVVDRPDLCTATTPSIVDRDPVVVAIGTEGTAPVLARQIKTRLESQLEPRLGDLAALSGRMRTRVAERLNWRERRDFWRWVFNGPVREAHARGAEREAAERLKEAIEAGVAPAAHPTAVALVDARAGAADLMTLRAVQRLQEADVIIHDAEVDPGVLELARRDADRLPLVGAGWPAARVAGVVSAEVAKGSRVVRLVSHGDMEAEETALTAQALTVEWVAGVPAAERPAQPRLVSA